MRIDLLDRSDAETQRLPAAPMALAIVLSLTSNARAIARSLIPRSRRCFALSAILR